jgi:putative ABC transport system permease protein
VFGSVQGALGRAIGVEADFVPARRIVGVVRETALNDRERAGSSHIYVPFAQNPTDSFTIVACCVPAARVWDAILPGPNDAYAARDLASLGTLLARRFSLEQAVSIVLGAFGFVALIISGLSVYGVSLLHFRRREHELGVRIALGADHKQLRRRLYANIASRTAIATAAGITACVIVLPFLNGLLPEAIDSPAIATTTIVMVGVTAIASRPVSRRISSIAPVALLMRGN